MRCDHYCNTIHCWTCIRRFYQWAQQHTRGKAKRKRNEGQVETAMSFYEHASLSYDQIHGVVRELVNPVDCDPIIDGGSIRTSPLVTMSWTCRKQELLS